MTNEQTPVGEGAIAHPCGLTSATTESYVSAVAAHADRATFSALVDHGARHTVERAARRAGTLTQPIRRREDREADRRS